MRKILLAMTLLASSHTARARQTPEAALAAARSAMEPFSILEGRWTGTGTFTMGPGRSSDANVTENGAYRLDGTVFVLEGLGHAVESVNGEHPVVHNALGIVSFDPAEGVFRMRAYRLGGQFVDAEITVEGHTLHWGFDDPRAGRIRYDIVIDPDVSWHETGQISRDDGATWYPFFEMNLTPDPDR